MTWRSPFCDLPCPALQMTQSHRDSNSRSWSSVAIRTRSQVMSRIWDWRESAIPLMTSRSLRFMTSYPRICLVTLKRFLFRNSVHLAMSRNRKSFSQMSGFKWKRTSVVSSTLTPNVKHDSTPSRPKRSKSPLDRKVTGDSEEQSFVDGVKWLILRGFRSQWSLNSPVWSTVCPM